MATMNQTFSCSKFLHKAARIPFADCCIRKHHQKHTSPKLDLNSVNSKGNSNPKKSVAIKKTLAALKTQNMAIHNQKMPQLNFGGKSAKFSIRALQTVKLPEGCEG
jgi:hypothetical protein